jgi:PPM family protein phosphatase
VIRVRAGSATDTGLVRTNNEDAALVGEDEQVFAVADGMGGHVGGEVASQVALHALRAHAQPTVDGMVRAVQLANQAVIDRAEDDPELRGMGTTLTTLSLVRTEPDGESPGSAAEAELFLITNVGDSRGYLFRDGDLEQVTVDHSLVEDLVREGRLPPEEARTHPQRNIVTRALGNEPDVEVDPFPVVPRKGDRFVLCSDGLCDELTDDRIAGVLRRLRDPNDAAGELVRLAKDAGGNDNITVVVVDVVDDGGRAEAASAALAAQGVAAPAASPTTVTASVAAPTETTEVTPTPGRDDPAPPTRKERRQARRRSRPRRITWRSVLFSLVFLALIGGAVGAVAWFARSTYYIGFQGDDVAIFRGQPGGVLWIEPTLEDRTGLTRADVPEERVNDLLEGKEVTSLADARRYVRDVLVEPARDDRRAATTTTSARAPAPSPGTT